MTDQAGLRKLFQRIMEKPKQIYRLIEEVNPEEEEQLVRNEEKALTRLKALDRNHRETMSLLDKKDYQGFTARFDTRSEMMEFAEKYVELRFFQAQEKLDLIEDEIEDAEEQMQKRADQVSSPSKDGLSPAEISLLDPVNPLSEDVEQKLNEAEKLFSQAIEVSEKFSVDKNIFSRGKDEINAIEELHEQVQDLHESYQRVKEKSDEYY